MDIRSKEIKRSTLQELLEYISSNRNVIQPTMYGKIVNMVPGTRAATDSSSQRTSSVLYRLPQILSAMSLIQRKMSPSWKLHGLIYRSYTSSFSASSSPRTSMSQQQNHTSIPNLCFRYLQGQTLLMLAARVIRQRGSPRTRLSQNDTASNIRQIPWPAVFH
jgi:hypothetical protein